MAALHHDESAPPRTAPPALRSYRSTYALQDRTVEDLQRQAQDRSSPFGTVRSSTAQSGIRETNGDHRRLMLEALTMFESHLSRLPPMGQTTTSTIPEVFQSAQHLVHSLDKLNGMLKEGTNKALEAQIDAELADYKDGVDLPELWREVGSDHRENLRVSDEVVRNITGFLLGVGKILREATSGTQHLRSMSLDEEVARRMTPDIQLNGNGRDLDGRRSSLRRSWEPGKEASRLMARLSTGLEENGRTGSRPGSALNVLRSSTTTSSSEERSVVEANDGTPATVRQSAPLSASTSAARRLYTPRERVDSNAIPFSPDEFGALPDYEPSPTPLSRQSHASLPNHRALPPLAVAPSLPTVPSERLLTRSSTSSMASTQTSTDKLSRRKISASSIVTIRPETIPFTPSIKPSNTTTAVTTATVSISPEGGAAPFPLLRSESGSSSRSNGVTFSRPSTASVSTTLTGLQKQHERAPTLSPSAIISSPQSGSESERDRDRESRSRTISARPRVSMESTRGEASPVEAAVDQIPFDIRLSTISPSRMPSYPPPFPPLQTFW
uniref:Aspartyl proteinase n=1 Tax=Ganoderma boninense TaxID=34458 RepID=A0A5K1K5K3_9APHY|nr:Aspartyl proteinase [Ganoderma boninense]